MKPTKVTPQERFARMLEVDSSATALGAADAAIAPMLSLAVSLRSAAVTAAPAPLSIGTRAAMRQRLVAVATVQGQDAAADRLRRRYNERTSTRLQKRLVALAGSVAVLTSVAGVGIAAAHSLPGDPFYGVKRATETVQLWASRGDAAKGARHLEFARERLAEARALPSGSTYIASTLRAMNTQTVAGSHDLVAAYNSSHSIKQMTELVIFAQQQFAGLVQLAKSAPPSLSATEISSMSVLGGVASTVRSVTGQNCLTCLVAGTVKPLLGPTPPATTPQGSHPTGPPTPQRSPHPATSPSSHVTPTQHPTSPAIHPSKTPSGLIPTNLLPTKLLPSPLGKHHKHTDSTPLPIISALLRNLHL